LDAPAVHLDDRALGIDAPALFAHGLAVHAHPSLRDEFFGCPARSDACSGEHLLQADTFDVLLVGHARSQWKSRSVTGRRSSRPRATAARSAAGRSTSSGRAARGTTPSSRTA